MKNDNEYISRRIVKETAKAYLVEQIIDNKRDGCKMHFKWVAKSVCKPSELSGEVKVPTSCVPNGVW